MKEVVNHHRLVDIQFEIPLATTDGDGRVVAHHLSADHGHGFSLSWIDLSRHDRRTRFIRWKR